MPGLRAIGVCVGVVLAATMLLAPTAVAAGPPCDPNAPSCVPTNCDPNSGSCNVNVGLPGSPGSTPPPSNGGGNQGGSGPTTCTWQGQTEPCYIPEFGWFNPSNGCYYRPAAPVPPGSDPVWEGHYPAGAIYNFTCAAAGTGQGLVWLPTPPPGAPTVTPEQLARQALASLTLPVPTIERSPTAANSDHGTPYTWVNLWTWYWTDRASWRTLTATASAGPVWATVTVAPARLTFEPGDGSAAQSCAGPGRAWTPADGNGAPTNGGCGYVYRHVAPAPVTATVAIEWQVTWVGSGGTSGTLPDMRTQATSSFAVEQIQVVNR